MYREYEDFGQDYWRGTSVEEVHDAGFSNYSQTSRNFESMASDVVEAIRDQGLDPRDTSVVVAGCAFGYTVEVLDTVHDVPVQGIDFSEYAVREAAHSASDKLSVGDVLDPDDIPGVDVAYNECLLSCLTDGEAIEATQNLRNSSSEFVIHRCWPREGMDDSWYNTKEKSKWRDLVDPHGKDIWL